MAPEGKESIEAGKHVFKWQAWQQEQEAEKSQKLLQTRNREIELKVGEKL